MGNKHSNKIAITDSGKPIVAPQQSPNFSGPDMANITPTPTLISTVKNALVGDDTKKCKNTKNQS